jgi:hypothetical protein
MAVAYLIRAHHRPEQLVRLVERLTTSEATFFVHLDARAPQRVLDAMQAGLAGRDDVHWVPRVAAHYSGFSLVRAIISGLEEVTRAGAPPHTVLLSGQCYPLRPASEIEAYLSSRPAESLVEHFHIPSERWADEDGGLDRLRYMYFERIRYRTRTLRAPLVRRFIPEGLEPWGGSAWCVLSDDAVRSILAFRDEQPEAYRFFEHVRAPDEIFLQTVLMNGAIRERVANEAIHYIEWPGGSHPRTFTSDDLDRISSSGKLFARKFDTARDAEILDRIDRELLGEG